MGKVAENEEIKLTATFCNNIAAGLFLTGALIPYLGLFQIGPGQAQDIFHELLAGNISQQGSTLILKLIAFFASLALSALFRWLARVWIRKIQD